MQTSKPTLRAFLVCFLLLASSAVTFAASGDDFYERLYDRGVSHYLAGNNADAYSELQVAAFGFVDQLDKYELAQSYMAIAAQRLGHGNDAHDALQKLLTAEKIQPHFRSLALPADVRAQLTTVATSLLTREEAVRLGVLADTDVADAGSKPTVVVPSQGAKPNVALTVERRRDRIEGANPPEPIAIDPTLSEAEHAIDAGELARARTLYASVLGTGSLSHAQALRAAEGMYRAHDFAGAVRAFAIVGALEKGEEPFRYYYAVALYEVGRFAEAKRELTAALPFIVQSPDVAAYRAKIESAH